MKQILMGAVAAMAMTVMAEITNTVTVTKFHQSYPYSGKATIEYTVGGTLLANAVAEIVLNTDDASATFIQSNIVVGANSHVIDFASSFDGVLLLTNASFEVTITEGLGGVQLWENGPYWAECNVGATKPEEYGYYFWWGDTVGYTRSGGTLDEFGFEGYCYFDVTWVSSTGERMDNSPFTDYSCPTYGKEDSELLSAGYIDSTGNLMAAYDAATAHLGSPWRLPTSAEIDALISNCTTMWIITNGVSGQLVTGKGDYANRRIFLPAVGLGFDSNLSYPDSHGNYWSSTSYSDDSLWTWCLEFDLIGSISDNLDRCFGQSVRPVRGFTLHSADGIVTYDPSPVTETTPVPVPYAWLDGYPALLAEQSGDHEAAAQTTAAIGRKVWECYVVGLDPSDPLDDFRITRFWMDGNVPMFEFNHTTDGSGHSILPYVKPLGKAKLMDAWLHVPDGGNPAFRFFAVEVVPPGCVSVVEEKLGGVQLWENGPYWAECNVGATKPEEYGYYFWWGDTVGYTRSGGMWGDYGWGDGSGCYSGVMWVSNTGERMGNSPFTDSSCSTYGKDNAALLPAGYIDSTGNLALVYDAAMAHLGSPWRMPTGAEIEALINNCTTIWITTNGVSGQLVTGKGGYAQRSIFLPAAGYGYGSLLESPGSLGFYWSSSPLSDGSYDTWGLDFGSGDFHQSYYGSRYHGRSVRPVRGFSQ